MGPISCPEDSPPPPELGSPISPPPLQQAESTLSDYEGLRQRMSQNQQIIVDLLTEFFALKNELQQREQERLEKERREQERLEKERREQERLEKERREQERLEKERREQERLEQEQLLEQLNSCQHIIALQEQKLARSTRALVEAEQENWRLHQRMEKMLAEQDDSRWPGRDALPGKLTDAEVDGEAAGKVVLPLEKEETEPAASDSSSLDSSLSDLSDVSAWDASESESSDSVCFEQPELLPPAASEDMLLRRLAAAESEKLQVVLKLRERDREVTRLSKHLDTEKNKTQNLELTQIHLENQKLLKDDANELLMKEKKDLERAFHQQKEKTDQLTERLNEAARQSDAVNKATQTEQRGTECREETAGQLRTQLMEMEKQVAEALSDAKMWQSRHSQEVKAKEKVEAELSLLLNRREVEPKEQLNCAGSRNGTQREDLLDHLDSLTAENTAAKPERHTLQAAVSEVKKKLLLSQAELQQIQLSLRQNKRLLDDYKLQILNALSEKEEYCARLAQAEEQEVALRHQLKQEIDGVRQELLARLVELEALPKALRRSQLQLQEAQQRERIQEQRNTELSTTVLDLQMKVEAQANQIERFRKENKVLLEDNDQQRVESLERKQEELGSQSVQLLPIISEKEGTIHSNQLCLDEKSEEVLDDARQDD